MPEQGDFQSQSGAGWLTPTCGPSLARGLLLKASELKMGFAFLKSCLKKKNLKSSVYNRDCVAGLKYLLPSGPCETQLAVSQHFIQGVESHECQPAHNMASVSNELVFLLVSVEDSNNSRYIRS